MTGTKARISIRLHWNTLRGPRMDASQGTRDGNAKTGNGPKNTSHHDTWSRWTKGASWRFRYIFAHGNLARSRASHPARVRRGRTSWSRYGGRHPPAIKLRAEPAGISAVSLVTRRHPLTLAAFVLRPRLRVNGK